MSASIAEIVWASLDETVPVNQLLQKFLLVRISLQVVVFSAPAKLVISPRILAPEKIKEQH
jgi:hypothetical protein